MGVDVLYDNSIKWKNFAEFTEIAARNLQLPANKWRYESYSGSATSKEYATKAVFNCGPFLLVASYNYQNFGLSLVDKALFYAADAENTANFKKIQEKDEAKKRAFKP